MESDRRKSTILQGTANQIVESNENVERNGPNSSNKYQIQCPTRAQGYVCSII